MSKISDFLLWVEEDYPEVIEDVIDRIPTYVYIEYNKQKENKDSE